MKPLLIYHGNCQDGFGAAWAVWKRHGDDFDYHPGIHQEPPPDVSGRRVVIADFAYPAEIMRELNLTARRITIIDHHISAAKELQPLLDSGEIDGIFDMNKSGAMLTWEWFHPGQKPPRLLEYIQDRDLYRFDLPDSRAISSALFSHPQEFQLWDELMASDLEQLRQDGIAIERKHRRDLQKCIDSGVRRMRIAGMDVPAINLPFTMSSDAGNILSQGEPFAVSYWETAELVVFSLRSAENGMDVSEIARSFGGGGHKRAAGFRLTHEEAAALWAQSETV
jgi:oligoribonuclease NrnB/cAMP/cGMP phosphodiesterase (DHH superfamily)